MVDVIEISEESVAFRDDILKNDEPEVYNLDDSLSFSHGQQANYPSSPQPISEHANGFVEVIQSNPASSEISVPFCHDLSTTDNEALTSYRPESLNQPTTSEKNKKVLDKILDTNSSPNSSIINENRCESEGVSIKNLATKWTKIQELNSARPSSALENDFLAHAPKLVPSGAAQDILADYPLSSPVVDCLSDEKIPEGEPFTSPKQKDINNNQRLQSSPAENLINFVQKEIGIGEGTFEGKIQKVHKPKRQSARSSSLRPDTVELNLSKFLTDRREETPPSSRRKARADSKNGNEPPRVITNNRDLENRKLEQYILRGKYYTQQESDALLRYWLKEDKKRFKQANQIYRSNENARSSIIMEISFPLLAAFQQNETELEKVISPATLQVGYDHDLPRIRFLRRFTSTYDFNHDMYYPSELKIMEENINILFYDAQTFFELYRNDKRKLFDVIQSFSKSDKYLIVALNDFNKLKRSMESLEDHMYKARVQEHLTGSQHTISHNKKMESIRNLQMKTFDLEQRLRHIDRLWNVKLHIVNSTMEFISTLPNLVSIIGRQRMDPAIRFMRYSHLHVRSSKDKTDALRQTLHHINKMPELKCNSVTNAYPTFHSLFADLVRGQLKTGLDGNHLMTTAMESRLYKLFTSRNPNETIQ